VALASHKMYMNVKDIVASHFLQIHFSVCIQSMCGDMGYHTIYACSL